MEPASQVPEGGVAPMLSGSSFVRPPAAPSIDLPVKFTGSGSEYFRIWIVNLLLTLVTLGIYFPWAKVRRLRYFYGNTVVADHSLDFHGDPKRMLRGYLLVGALVVMYSLAGKYSPTAGLVAFLMLAGLWPALFRASQRFRMANTSWRGLRFHFTGDLGGAYRAVLPLFIPGVLMLALVVMAGPLDGPAGGQAAPRPPTGALIALGLTPFVMMLLLPWLWWLLKKYQHDHYALGETQAELRVGPGSFYMVVLKTAGVVFLIALFGGILAAVLGGLGFLALRSGGEGGAGSSTLGGLAAAGFAVVLVITYLGILLAARPYATSRMQNLVWTNTKSPSIRFISDLRFWPLFGRTVLNGLLTVLTLGLYWPFAAVAMARLRLEAVTVRMRKSPDELMSKSRERGDDASGDAAGDLFGIDIGL